MQVGCQVFARRLHVTDDRYLLAHALIVVDGPFDIRRMRDGEEVQHRVGRTTGGHNDRNRILDRLAGDDVARLEVVLHRLNQHARRLLGRAHFFFIRVRHR